MLSSGSISNATPPMMQATLSRMDCRPHAAPCTTAGLIQLCTGRSSHLRVLEPCLYPEALPQDVLETHCIRRQWCKGQAGRQFYGCHARMLPICACTLANA